MGSFKLFDLFCLLFQSREDGLEEAVLEMAVDELKPQVSSVKGGKHVLNKKIKEQTKSLATEKERSTSPEGRSIFTVLIKFQKGTYAIFGNSTAVEVSFSILFLIVFREQELFYYCCTSNV